MLHEAGSLVKVGGRRLPVIARHRVDDMHRSTGGAVVHAVAGEIEVEPGIAAIERDAPRRLGQHVFDERTGIAQAPVIAEDGPRIGHHLDAGLGGLGEPDHFQRLERGLVDPEHILVA